MRFCGSGSCSVSVPKRIWRDVRSRIAFCSAAPRRPRDARSCASVVGAPVGHDQPSLPISMRNDGRVARQSPERVFSTPDVDSGPR